MGVTHLCLLLRRKGRKEQEARCATALAVVLLCTRRCAASLRLAAGKNESEEKRELVFKEDGQGASLLALRRQPAVDDG